MRWCEDKRQTYRAQHFIQIVARNEVDNNFIES